MYLAVDIGGTKTLLAVFNSDGQVARRHKFATPADYPTFLEEFERTFQALEIRDLEAAGVAVPGLLDRKKGVVISCGNLPWRNLPIEHDIKKIVSAPVAIENDTKLAALSEAVYIIDDYKKVLYLTISTGIGMGVIINGKIEPALADAEGGFMMNWHQGKLEIWERFASGKAIHKRTGKLASEIPVGSELWTEIVDDLAPGIYNILAIVQPEVIIIGGGVGEYLPRYQANLTEALKALETPMVKIPPIKQAHHAEDAVIYGAYHLVNKEWREHYG